MAFDLWVDTMPSSPLPLVTLTDQSNVVVASIYLLADGSIVSRWGNASNVTPLGSLLPVQWHHVEIGLNSSSSGLVLTAWLDGVAIDSSIGRAVAVETVLFGSWTTDQTWQIHIDNAALAVDCLGACPAAEPEATTPPEVADPVIDGTPAT